MKTTRIFATAILATLALSISAQQVNTLYFMENAPMRHTINPAFQPVSQGYVNFTPLGWMSGSLGNNSLTISDIFMVDPTTGKTITVLHPNANKQAFLRNLRAMTYGNGDLTLGILNFGFRYKEVGYVTIGINERIEAGATLPRSIGDFLLNGGMSNTALGGVNTLGLGGLGMGATMYAEVSGGYSHRINEQWTVGGKLKVLLGQVKGMANTRNLTLDASSQSWHLYGDVGIDLAANMDMSKAAAAFNGKSIPQVIDGMNNGTIDLPGLFDAQDMTQMLIKVAVPSGYGAAIDLGFTYKPIENLQISAALTDLGFIYWTKAGQFNCHVDTTFTGAGDINYGDAAYRDQNGNFSTAIVMDTVMSRLSGLVNGAHMTAVGTGGMAKMVSTRLNVGIDANFWDNRVGVGIVSATRLYNARLYEEVTIGAAFRPVNWFNLAVSYSLLNNGKYSNIGAGLGFMPYDGINLTLAMDYIPTSYAAIPTSSGGSPLYVLPDKAKMVNFALGFSICWGTNRRDKDKDGVWDKIDMCPNTPRGVKVDSVGCPLDLDHDGVPDYLDSCPNTIPEAVRFVDEFGCSMDSDGDGVEDYMDKCPNTPKEAYGMVDSVGCPMDSDGDGVPDYIDRCPETPKEAYGLVDNVGCPIDTDGDGVADYMDECPDTPKEAYGKVDAKGCPIDSDGDGVPDYKDECPDTPIKAVGFVDAKGCELDSDGDGIYDYMDECPHVAGVAANKGCPELKREVRQLLQKAMQGIEFETGKSTIKAKSNALLDQIAKTFIENENYIIEVQGHTDNIGKEEFNNQLSDLRAHAVMNYLIGKGVPAQRMTAVGYGPSAPIADNKTAAGRQKNRRVEFKITFEEVHEEIILDHADPKPETQE